MTAMQATAKSKSKSSKSTPAWVTTRPVDEAKYIGISRVPTTEADCREKAAKLALDEIAAQICVNTESESFLRMVVVDGRSNEMLENTINQSVSMELEGQQIKDSYESESHYYVYYELDKEAYYKSVAQKRERATQMGLDLYNKGYDAESSGNLMSAAQLYANGLESIEPYLYLSLTTTRNGAEFNVANELYNAYINVFNGLTITTNVRELAVEAFTSNQYPVAACISRNNKVLQNIELVATFTSGSGSITPSVKSDVNGTSIFYLTNVTSKQPIQSITISIGDSLLETAPEPYRELLKGVNLPSANIALALVSSNHTARFKVEKSDIEACEAQVKMLLANNYFEIIDSEDAELQILYLTDFRAGSTVSSGGTFDLNEYYCSLKLEIYDNESKTLLLNYSIPEQRVLVPVNQTSTQAKMTCARELTKIIKRELPQELKNMNINK